MIAIHRLVFFIVLSLNAITCLSKPTILVLGDSLSAAYQIPPESGWVTLLQNKLNASHPQAIIVNSSIVGDTTANGLQRFPPLLDKYHPDIVILELGGNDGLRGLPVQTIKSNLDQIIKLALKTNARLVLVGIKLPPNYGPNYNNQFETNYLQLSQENQVALVPFMLEKIALSPTLMLPDRIHPTAAAQPIILENIWPYLEPLL